MRNLVFILSFSIPACFAMHQGIDPNIPIQIQSDIASFEQISRQAIHEGNVILVQGSHELRADKLTMERDLKGHLNLITAKGNPATFQGKLNENPEPIHATAKTIYYYPAKQLIILEGAATLSHLQDEFQGPTLRYQLDTQVVTATKQSNERPIITFYPRS